jgi:hypothetical protein
MLRLNSYEGYRVIDVNVLTDGFSIFAGRVLP